MFGNPETTTGGNALKFYASVRLDIRRIGAIKDKENVVGNETRVKVVKNKVAPPFKEVEFDIMYNEGISKIGDLLDIGTEYGIIQKGGSWYTYGEERVQGRDTFKKILAEKHELLEKLETDIKNALNESNTFNINKHNETISNNNIENL